MLSFFGEYLAGSVGSPDLSSTAARAWHPPAATHPQTQIAKNVARSNDLMRVGIGVPEKNNPSDWFPFPNRVIAQRAHWCRTRHRDHSHAAGTAWRLPWRIHPASRCKWQNHRLREGPLPD